MKHLLILGAAVPALAGCQGWTLDGQIDANEAVKIGAAVQLIENQRALWNDAGYDPVQAPVPTLALASVACTSLSMAGALSDPSIGETVQKVCDAVLGIAGSAQAAPE
jgi:hypothetical protein